MRFLVAISLSIAVAMTRAHAGAQGPERDAIRAALCETGVRCRVQSILPAGRGAGGRVAVVRLRVGRPVCREPREQAYRDWLVVIRPSGVRPLRELTRGDIPCLEWELSEWTYEDGELVFHHGGLGAPPGRDYDTRRQHTHFRPWPLEMTRRFAGDEPIAPTPVLPPEGPLFWLSMEHEGETL